MQAEWNTNTHSHVPEENIQWTDKLIKQLSMQCHVRTVCSTISAQNHWEWPAVHLWLCLLVRQRNRDRPDCWWTAVRSSESIVGQWCYDADAIKCQYVIPGNTSKTLYGCKLITVLQSAMVFCHVSIRIQFKAVTRVCSPNQHVTYLQTAVWIQHKLLSKYHETKNYNLSRDDAEQYL